MRHSARCFLALALVMTPADALAQATFPGSQAPGKTAPAQGAPATSPPAGQGTGAASEKPSGGAEAGAAGYAYKDAPQRKKTGGARVAKRAGPVATLPGFEIRGDGGSRLFVALTQQVQVEERRAQGSFTYVLKGAHIDRRNNMNVLETIHFNTPVSRARLVPKGNDLLFIVDLRAASTPTWKMQGGENNTGLLVVDFGGGEFLTGNERTPQPKSDAAKPDAKKKGGGQPAAPGSSGSPPKPDGTKTGPNP